MEGKQLEFLNPRRYCKDQIGDWLFEDGFININRVIEELLNDVIIQFGAWYYLHLMMARKITISCRWGELIPLSINKERLDSYYIDCDNGIEEWRATRGRCRAINGGYILEFIFPEWLVEPPLERVKTIIHELLHIPYMFAEHAKLTPHHWELFKRILAEHTDAFYTGVRTLFKNYVNVMNPRLKAALYFLDGEEHFMLEYHGVRQKHIKRLVSSNTIRRSFDRVFGPPNMD